MVTKRKTKYCYNDDLVGKFVWVADDEKYGCQGIFSNKKKSIKGAKVLGISGAGCVVLRMKVR